jgi:HPt (histidine-containing phosphotransfer) domain-containing protein
MKIDRAARVSTLNNVITKPKTEPMDALDLRALAQLAAIERNGRPGFVKRVIALFLQTASNLIKDLEAASTNNDPASLHRASHG